MIVITSNANRGCVNNDIYFDTFKDIIKDTKIVNVKTRDDFIEYFIDLVDDYYNSPLYRKLRKVLNPIYYRISVYIEDGSRFSITVNFRGSGNNSPNITYKELSKYEVDQYDAFVVYVTDANCGENINIHTRYIDANKDNLNSVIAYDVNSKFREVLYRAKNYFGVNFKNFNEMIDAYCTVWYYPFIKNGNGFYTSVFEDDGDDGCIRYNSDIEQWVVD